MFQVLFVSFSFCLYFGTMHHFNYIPEPNYGWEEPHFGNMGRFESPYNTWKKMQPENYGLDDEEDYTLEASHRFGVMKNKIPKVEFTIKISMFPLHL